MESVVNKIAKFSTSFSLDEDEFEENLKLKSEEVRNLCTNDPKTFVNKFSHLLNERDCNILLESCNDSDTQEILNLCIGRISQSRKNIIDSGVKNRRYFYILTSLDSYFSLENIKQRYPLLFNQYLGKFGMEDRESVASLSNFFMDRLVKHEHKKMLNKEMKQELEILLDQDNFVENMNIDTDEQKNFAFLKKELYSLVFQEFISGNDKTFDYSKIDNVDTRENSTLISSYAEDKYFDSEVSETCGSDEIENDDL
ncbi:hypothetical protein RF11_03445 [Thelohanellus kitauei]|uniref:CCD97-like C-terminal domain-containing protein n=1 Tax=Thelohanellus kitauei TaxID=669202 RepID=A0A0C2MAF2_THEKT|nr:hypothetical protein RF11_03445 [Thelohanellus kitauei]